MDQPKVSSLFLRRVTVTVTELVKLDKMRNKFYFLKESFQEVKEIFKIINEKHNTPEKLTLEFAGVILKVHVWYQWSDTKVVYSIKTDKDETDSSWLVKCLFTNIKEFFLDEFMLQDVGAMPCQLKIVENKTELEDWTNRIRKWSPQSFKEK